MNQDQANKLIDAVMSCRNSLRDVLVPDDFVDPRPLAQVDTAAFQKVLDLIDEVTA